MLLLIPVPQTANWYNIGPGTYGFNFDMLLMVLLESLLLFYDH